MDEILEIGLLVFVIIVLRTYFETFADCINGKLYKKISDVYIRDAEFLLMVDDEPLLSLTIQKKGFDVHMRYFVRSVMIVEENGDVVKAG